MIPIETMKGDSDEDALCSPAHGFALDWSNFRSCSNKVPDAPMSCVRRHIIYSNSGAVWNGVGRAVLPSQIISPLVQTTFSLLLILRLAG